MSKLLRRVFSHLVAIALLAHYATTNASEEAESSRKTAHGDAAENSTRVCTGFRFDVDKELELFGGKPRSVAASTSAASATTMDVNQLYAVTLTDYSKVTFAAKAGRPAVAEGTFAGLLKVTSPRATTIRVTSTEAAWLDVISSSKLLESQRHTGSGNCKVLRKVVEFTVTPGQPLTVQVSGSKEKVIKLAVTSVEKRLSVQGLWPAEF